jgi:hypothetical protein
VLGLILLAAHVAYSTWHTDQAAQAFNHSTIPANTIAGVPEPRFFTENDSYAWLAYVRDRLNSGDWRCGGPHMDNAPHGREMHWSHLLIWTLRGLATAIMAATGWGPWHAPSRTGRRLGHASLTNSCFGHGLDGRLSRKMWVAPGRNAGFLASPDFECWPSPFIRSNQTTTPSSFSSSWPRFALPAIRHAPGLDPRRRTARRRAALDRIARGARTTAKRAAGSSPSAFSADLPCGWAPRVADRARHPRARDVAGAASPFPLGGQEQTYAPTLWRWWAGAGNPPPA